MPRAPALPGTDRCAVVQTFEDDTRRVILALGFAGSYRIENTLDQPARLVDVARVERFVQLIDELDEECRSDIGLTPQRHAALIILDELRGLYATGELAAARRLSERCLRDLDEACAGIEPHDDGALKRPIVRTHAELGRLTEQALAAFLRDIPEALGRAHQVVSLAAELEGEPRSLERRRAAFATTAPADHVMVELPVGVVHPAMWPAVAQRLGMPVDEVRQLLCDPADRAEDLDRAAELRARLGDELLVRALPIVPKAERPTRYLLPGDRYGEAFSIEDPLSNAYTALEHRIALYRRLAEVAPAHDVARKGAPAIQREVERVAQAAHAAFDVRALDGWGVLDGQTSPTLDYRGPDRATDGDTPPSCAWLTDDRVAIARADVLQILSLAERRVVHEAPLGAVRIQACDDTGRYLVVTACSTVFAKHGIEGFGCYDVATGAWLEAMPAPVPTVSFGKHQAEDGLLFDQRRGGLVYIDGERPTALAWARGNRAVLLSGHHDGIANGQIRSTQTCLVEVSFAALQIDVPADCTTLHASDDADERVRSRYRDAPCAIAQVDGRWRFLLPSLHVADVDRAYFRLGFPIDAAAFSPDGTRLLLLADELLVIDIADRAIVWRAAA